MSATPNGDSNGFAPQNGAQSPSGAQSVGANGDAASQQRRKVPRSRAGCLTCRQRRKLCNMDKPECGACSRLKLECRWPTNAPGEASRGASTRKRYDNPAVPPIPVLTPMSRQTTTPAPPPPPLVAAPIVPPMQYIPPHNGTDFMGVYNDPVYPPSSSAAPLPDNAFAGFDFDDATLQQWAAELFNVKEHADPWDSLSSLLAPRSSTPVPVSTFPPTPAGGTPSLMSPVGHRPIVASEAPHKPLLAHYQDSLSRLVACIPEDGVNSFDAFTTLASATASSPAGKGLHLATLAWAGRHMSNLGQVKYEALSERLAEQAKGILLGVLNSLTVAQRRGQERGLGETERMTLLGGTLMLVHFKICRGDVWGFDVYVEYLRDLSIALFASAPSTPIPSDSMLWSFFENIVFHDALSTNIMTGESIISPETLSAISNSSETPNTLTGSTFTVFRIMYQQAKLLRDGRHKRSKPWNDETLIDTVTAANALEKQLEDEKGRYAALVAVKPAIFEPWLYMHEAFRVASILCVRACILAAPPCSIGVRLLVRQNLHLLETMYEQDLPGFASAHWLIFITALCSCPGDGNNAELDDRARITRLYEATIGDLGFRNVERSRQVVHEVWKRNQEGRLFVDWLDIVQEWEWELYLV